jgi:hypothetical protein
MWNNYKVKTFLILLLSIFVTCGPSEAEIQERINQAVEEATSTTTTTTLAPTTSTTTTSTTTTTTLAPTTSTTTTSTTTTTTTTTIPYETLIEKCFLVEEVNIRMPQLIEFNFESNENLSINDSVNFSYKFIAGTYKINQIVIRYEDNYKNLNRAKDMIDYSSEGLPLEGIIETDPNEVGFQNGFSYGINSVNIIDEKGNQIHYLNMGQITNRVNKYWCELNHSFFTTDMIFKIEN